MGSCVNTFPREPIYRAGILKRSTPLPPCSTAVPARPSVGRHQPKPSTSTYTRSNKPVLLDRLNPVSTPRGPSPRTSASRPYQLDGYGRRLLRQCTDGVVLGLDADRAAQPSVVAEPRWSSLWPWPLTWTTSRIQTPDTVRSAISLRDKLESLTLNHHPAGHIVLKSGPLNGVKPRYRFGLRGLNPGPLDPPGNLKLSALRRSPKRIVPAQVASSDFASRVQSDPIWRGPWEMS